MRREEGAGDGDVDGSNVGGAVVGSDNNIDFGAARGGGAKAFRSVDGGGEKIACAVSNEADESVVAAVTVATSAASEVVQKMGSILVEVMTIGNG